MTTEWPEYELVDFGMGRKLERFGPWLLDRPCPASAAAPRQKPQAWRDATARYDGQRAADGKWTPAVKRWQPPQCQVSLAELGFSFELSPLPSGQIGVFPEQFENWRWIVEQVERAQKPLQVLNLFAYTGGSTLAAASRGATVTHVDAAKSMVARAKANSAESGLGEAAIRWIVEDAVKFCQREIKRGSSYDAVILDPPSYGHGPQGEAWSIRRDLMPLLKLCGQLTENRNTFVLCTCHTPDIGPAELSAYLSDGLFGHCAQPPRSGPLFLRTAQGRKLPSGTFARWPT